ncbi:hypothetical protein [Ignicoccus hospitalis]|uniref:C2H2-type domain-containing protein n=1 Tax=Ignicoccus hospitalis (strain KIN4/I / DSM 18386 / JCM 14125) TaxID=453591 RepID=A8A9K3_IGNH4|nr:hypothetical protein [Ignicoccus hospitalis]ABU81605.1 hypothetical protein Igni_0422 [Ignicoccus hospitalis KIN4/I]HIH90199.1 hypothetical protein [Desulfurococcaceae archaeon]
MDLDRLADIAIRIASRMRIREELLEGVSQEELEAAKRVAEMVREERKGLVYCAICAKGSFTKRGFYLHLMRVHKDDIKVLLERELSAPLAGQ